VKPRPHLHRSSQTFQRTNFLPVQPPVHTEPCKFCCRLPCVAGVRRGSEGDFERERTRGTRRREGGRKGKFLPSPSCAVSRPNSLSLASYRLTVCSSKTCTVLRRSRVNERPFYASFCPFKNLSGTVKTGLEEIRCK